MSLYHITAPQVVDQFGAPLSTINYYHWVDFIYWDNKEEFIFIFNNTSGWANGGIVTKWSKEKNPELYHAFLARYLPHAITSSQIRNELRVFPQQVELRIVNPTVLLTSDFEQFRDYGRKILKDSK